MKKTTYSILVSSLAIASTYTQAGSALRGALAHIFPQNVTAQEIGLKTASVDNITQVQQARFDEHLQTVMIDAQKLIKKWWETIKDLVSENGKGSNIKYYSDIFAELHKELGIIIVKNESYQHSISNIHPAHKCILTLSQNLLRDLSDAVHITKSVLENKKLYQSKATKKPSSAKLSAELRKRLAKYTTQKELYIKKIAYLWKLADQAGHVKTIAPLAHVIGAIYQDYHNNKKLFSTDCMGVAIQHKLNHK